MRDGQRLGLVLACALASSACLRQTEYQCSANATCGAGNQCESTGYCSVPDSTCDSGRRYSDSAGSLGGTCVEGGTTVADANDQPVDGTPNPGDGSMPDTPPVGSCPSGYVALTGGQAGHLYRVLTTTGTWSAQHAFCQATTASAYLAIPDNAGELDAMDTAAGIGAVYWVGISDTQTENTWVNVLGATQTFLPWLTGQPDDSNPGEDCVAANATLDMFTDERCNGNRIAICECAP